MLGPLRVWPTQKSVIASRTSGGISETMPRNLRQYLMKPLQAHISRLTYNDDTPSYEIGSGGTKGFRVRPFVRIITINRVNKQKDGLTSITSSIHTFVRHHLPQPLDFDSWNDVNLKWRYMRNNTVTSLRVDRSVRSLIEAE